ncbi:hypothetical protein CsSME_00008025 [Camellia sinensis var. sinensis]
MMKYDFWIVQVSLVATSMTLHNFIRRNSLIDEVMQNIQNAEDYETLNFPDHPTMTIIGEIMMPGDEDIEMANVRATIACALVA